MKHHINRTLPLFLFQIVLFSTHAQVRSVQENTTPLTDTASVDIDEVIITENRLMVPFHRLNRNLEILSQEQIQALPVRSLNELLSHINGVDLRQRGPFGTQADVGIDGGTFEQASILINGIKVVDPQTGHNSLNLPIPTDAIERIEVIRGPAARIYGINSLTGAINIVTKTPAKSGLSAHVMAGSNLQKDTAGRGNLFHGRGIQLGWHTVQKQHRHSLYGSHESGNGYRYNTAFRNHRVFYQGEVKPNDLNTLSLMGGYVSSDFGANGFYAAPGDIESQEIVQTALASIAYRSRLSSHFSLSPRVSYRYGYDDYRYFRHDLDRARSQHHTHTINTELNGTLHTMAGDIGMGMETRHERIGSTNIGHHQRNNYGLYTEFKTDRINRLSVNIGAYFNYNSDYGWQIFPGLDMGYQVDDKWRFVAQAGTGQRIPSFTDLYLDQRPGNIGNPTLRSENAWQAEAGIRRNDERWNLHARYFYRQINRFIDWVREDLDNPWQPINSAVNNTHGALVSFQYLLSSPSPNSTLWHAGLAYTYLSPTISQENEGHLSKYAIESLRHQITSHFGFSYQRISATAAARFHERISHQQYAIADIRLSYRLPRAGLYADIQNLFDVTYTEIAAVPMPGRWFTLGLQYHVF